MTCVLNVKKNNSVIKKKVASMSVTVYEEQIQ